MKFRIRELTPGYRLEVAVPTLQESASSEQYDPAFDVTVTWVPIGHPYGSCVACHAAAEQFARGGHIVEEFDVEYDAPGA